MASPDFNHPGIVMDDCSLDITSSARPTSASASSSNPLLKQVSHVPVASSTFALDMMTQRRWRRLRDSGAAIHR
eukprot:scaffold1375_cov255-Pinguiococcus_pyrenoidosus.AAC.6